MSYDRVLPNPAALHYESAQVTLPPPPRQTSNLLEHKIMNDDFSNKLTVLEHHHYPHVSDGHVHSVPQVHHLSSINRAKMAFNQLASVSPMETYKSIAPLPITATTAATTTATTKDIPIRKRSSQSERSSSSSPVKSSSSSSKEQQQPAAQFCLCQPDPKIPRPRNAFILYRQHYQAAVVAQNPGLANPDISKIIGEQWRKLPQETKDEWKALAEEEKARHQQQYPEYRYQPRRYGRDGNQRSNGPGISHTPSGSTVCNRCGGRIMNPPISSEAPFTPNGSSNSTAVSNLHPERLTVRSYPCHTKDADRPPIPIRLGSNDEPRSRSRQWDESGSQSPDSKRRRFNPQFAFKPNTNRDKSPESPYPVSPYGPRSDGFQSRGGRLQILHSSRQYPNVKDHPPHDPSLKLPPLQTTTAGPGGMTPITPFAQNGSNLETTVMTIPFLNKIKVLAKISPPLVPSFRDASSQYQRGAVVAVDGQDPALVKTMVDYLDNVLHKEGKYNSRAFEGPEVRPHEPPSESEQMGDATVDYLDTISAWHRISDEIVSFIRPSTGSPIPNSTEEDVHAGVSPKTILPEAANLQIRSPSQSSENGSAAMPSPSTASGGTIPIALVPRYQLTTADTFACSIPIHDSYAPLDHWQWMASLWRACVGPDITVYVRECEKDELDRLGGNPVEVRLQDARTVVVRKAAGSPKGLEEKALRRVGFEIEDFLTQ